MKTKWGSCNRETGHIWFNVELAKKHPESLEYLAVHEMTHLLERGHGTLHQAHGQLPADWRARRDQLNDAPLGRRGLGCVGEAVRGVESERKAALGTLSRTLSRLH